MNNSMEVISLIDMLIISRDSYEIGIEDSPLKSHPKMKGDRWGQYSVLISFR